VKETTITRNGFMIPIKVYSLLFASGKNQQSQLHQGNEDGPYGYSSSGQGVGMSLLISWMQMFIWMLQHIC